VVIGGSYPGALSAWFKEKYPHLAVASWASSAVVYPIANFWQFDEQIYTSTVKSGEECPNTINKIFSNVEDALLAGGEQRSNVIKRMNAYDGMDNGDFAFYFADIFVESVQYGSRTELCKLMTKIADKSLDDQLDAVAEQAQTAGVSPSDYCRNALTNTTIIDSPGRPWTYQYCTEFGFYQVPGENHPMRPQKLLGYDYWVDYCHSIFGLDLQINRTIAQFSFHHSAGSDTVYTNGVEDPWQWATELKPNSAIGQYSLMSDCTDCGHCVELYNPKDSDSDSLKKVRSFIDSWVDQYITSKEEPLFLQK